MTYHYQNAGYKKIYVPLPEEGLKQIGLTDETIKERYNKVLDRMKEENLSTLVIYEDLEHGSYRDERQRTLRADRYRATQRRLRLGTESGASCG